MNARVVTKSVANPKKVGIRLPEVLKDDGVSKRKWDKVMIKTGYMMNVVGISMGLYLLFQNPTTNEFFRNVYTYGLAAMGISSVGVLLGTLGEKKLKERVLFLAENQKSSVR